MVIAPTSEIQYKITKTTDGLHVGDFTIIFGHVMPGDHIELGGVEGLVMDVESVHWTSETTVSYFSNAYSVNLEIVNVITP